MDTVTESQMALSCARAGDYPTKICLLNSLSWWSSKRVKCSENGVIIDRFPNARHTVRNEWVDGVWYRISGVSVGPETLENRKLVGILTNRDLRLFLTSINLFPVMTCENLCHSSLLVQIWGPAGTFDIRIELPLVDCLSVLITVRYWKGYWFQTLKIRDLADLLVAGTVDCYFR